METHASRAETPPKSFEFITIVDPKQSLEPANRERVRRRAIQSYHQRRQRLSRGTNADSSRAGVDIPLQNAIPKEEAVEQAYFQNGLYSSFDRGTICQLDPFRRFPVPIDSASRQLLNHMYDGTCPMFRLMRNIGFLNAANEESSFLQLLSTSSWHMNQLRSNADSTSHLSYSVLALRSLNQRLKLPTTVLADETVGAMLAFACHSNVTNDIPSLNMHLDALMEIVRRRGGPSTLDANPSLRIMLFWVDLNGACAQDTSPRLPIPYGVLPPQAASDVSGLDSQDITTNPLKNSEAVGIFRSLHRLDQFIRDEAMTRDVWIDNLFPGYHVAPLLHHLLSMPHASPPSTEPFVILQEAFRLAGILYMGQLRVRFGAPSIPQARFVVKLHSLLSSERLDGKLTGALFTWALVAGGISSWPNHWFVDALCSVGRLIGCESFQSLKHAASAFPFFEAALTGALDAFGQLVDNAFLADEGNTLIIFTNV